MASSYGEDSQEPDSGGVNIPRPQPVIRVQAAALESVGNYVATLA